MPAQLRHSSGHSALRSVSRSFSFMGYSASCSPQAKPLDAYDFTRPTAVIMGNEHSGVSEEVLRIVNGELYIPMYGMIQSFNVSVAAAVILSEAARQRKAAGFYAEPTFSREELETRLADWLKR